MSRLLASAAPATPRVYAGQDHGKRVAARRQRFIEVGVALFGTVGYQATTVRTLTAAAGLSNRYFYESFESMEALLMACYEHMTVMFRARLDEVLGQAPAGLEARLEAGARAYFELMRDPHFARITQVEVLAVGARVGALYVKSVRDFGKLITQLIMSFAPPGHRVSKGELEVVGVALAGAMSTAGAVWMRSRYREDIDTIAAASLKVLMGAARALLGAAVVES